MKIDVRFHGLPYSEALRLHALRRIQSHLSCFYDQLTLVTVRVGDVNGPRGGVDKRCRVTVQGPTFGTAALASLHSSVYAAVDDAVKRAARTVARGVGRARSQGRRRPLRPTPVLASPLGDV